LERGVRRSYLQRWPSARSTYFRTGNAAAKFRQIDRYVVDRLRRFLVKRQGRNLRPGQARGWTENWFNRLGLHRLRGTIRYPEAA
jgi:RNA-directed DNA polymerase